MRRAAPTKRFPHNHWPWAAMKGCCDPVKTRCVVFGLSFDYIANYSAGQQLNGAGLLRAHRGCGGCMALLLPLFFVSFFFFLTARRKVFLIFTTACEAEGGG